MEHSHIKILDHGIHLFFILCIFHVQIFVSYCHWHLALANISGVPRPTIVTMTKSSTVKLSTIYGICDGLKITLQDFFASPLFDPENITD